MDFVFGLSELLNGNKITCSSIAKGHWLEINKDNKIVVVSPRGGDVIWRNRQDDLLAQDWESVTVEKIKTVELISETVHKAQCPSCLTFNTVPETDALAKKEGFVIICGKCGKPYGLKRDIMGNDFKGIDIKIEKKR